MEKEFDENVLYKNLIGLPFWKQLVFLISVCQRLIPSFSAFAKEVGASGENVLRDALSKAWDNLLAGKFRIDLSAEANQCESVAPDTEDYESIYVSSALDASIALSLLMKAFSDHDTRIIVEATTLIRDSVDMYVQDLENMSPNDPGLENKILSHDLMQDELRHQKDDIEFLAGLDDDPTVSVPVVKKRWFGNVESCLGLKI